MDEDRKKALAAALGQIERQFGKGSVMRMGDVDNSNVASISSGSLTLDIALGVGGYPRGRVVEIYGPESSGKTTLTLSVIAQALYFACQRLDMRRNLRPCLRVSQPFTWRLGKTVIYLLRCQHCRLVTSFFELIEQGLLVR